MERNNYLANNLKAYQTSRKISLAELSSELGIPRSTIQSVMLDGNTTVDTLVRMANALNISLDELVFGDTPAKQFRDVRHFLHDIGWFTKLSSEKQEKFRHHLGELLELLEHEN